jgi:hypothetical protein
MRSLRQRRRAAPRQGWGWGWDRQPSGSWAAARAAVLPPAAGPPPAQRFGPATHPQPSTPPTPRTPPRRRLDKIIIADSAGRVYVKGRHPRDPWPAAPGQGGEEGAADAALRWLEEFATRLEGGVYQVRGGGLEALGSGPWRAAAATGTSPRAQANPRRRLQPLLAVRRLGGPGRAGWGGARAGALRAGPRQAPAPAAHATPPAPCPAPPATDSPRHAAPPHPPAPLAKVEPLLEDYPEACDGICTFPRRAPLASVEVRGAERGGTSAAPLPPHTPSSPLNCCLQPAAASV